MTSKSSLRRKENLALEISAHGLKLKSEWALWNETSCNLIILESSHGGSGRSLILPLNSNYMPFNRELINKIDLFLRFS
jgi:hypothetical protein